MLNISMPSGRFTRRASAVLLGATLTGSVIAAPAHAVEAPAPVEQGYQAQARGLGITLKAGPILLDRYGFKDEHLGFLTLNGKTGICYDYGLKSPDGRWTDGPLAGIPKGKTRDRITWIANRYWADAQKNDANAAAYKSAINLLRSKEFASDWAKSYAPQLKHMGKAGVVEATERMVADSAKLAGQPKVSLDFTKPAPGDKGTAVVKVAVNGNAYPGMNVKWSLTGGVVGTGSKVTSKSGTAKLSFTRGAGPVDLKATVAVPEWRKAGYSIPSSGKIQHLVRGGFSTSLSAAGKFDSLAEVNVSSKCDGECEGEPPVTFSAKAASSPMQVRAVLNAKTVKTLSLAAGKSGSATFTGQDGATYGLQYRVQVAGKWSTWRTSGAHRVVCPAAPKLTIQAVCDCKGKGMATFTITNPGGPRTYEITYAGKTQRLGATSTNLQVPGATPHRPGLEDRTG